MLEKDSLIVGLLLGICIPFVGIATLQLLFEQVMDMEFLNPDTRTIHVRQRTTAILAICLNLIPFTFFKNRRFEESMRGIMLATIFYVFVWIYFFADLVFT